VHPEKKGKMATIAQTLSDIEQLQQDIEKHLNAGGAKSDQFIDDIRRITMVYYFDLLAHSSLDISRKDLMTNAIPLYKKYYSLSGDPELVDDYIRWLNIGGLFIVWNKFENFIRETYRQASGDPAIPVKEMYKAVLADRNVDQPVLDRMIGEFNLIRYVRNRFRQNGTHADSKTREFVLGKDRYRLEGGKPVKPIRLITVIDIIWQHYRNIS
jgi:hypothetical protein